MKEELISKTEAAKKLKEKGIKCDKPRMSRAVQDGNIASYDGKVKLSEALKFFQEKKERVKPSKRFTAAHALKEESLAESARLDALKKKIELDVLEDRLLDRAVAESIYTRRVRTLRDSILNIPSKVSQILAAMSDPFEIELLLNKEIRQALTDQIEEKSLNGGLQ